MKRQLLKSCDSNLQVVHDILLDLKREDIRARKKAKPSQKNKWTKSIRELTNAIELIIQTKRTVKRIPKRV